MDLKSQERQGRIDWIHSLGLPVTIEGAMHSIHPLGRRVDLWPSTDSYFRHDTQKYGQDICALCKKIKEALDKQKIST